MLRIFNVFVPTTVVALVLSELILIYTCLILAAALVIDVDLDFFLWQDYGFLAITIVGITTVLGLYFQDLYAQLRIRTRVLLVQQISLAFGLAFLTQALLNYINVSLMLPRWVMLYGCGMALVVLPLWRILYGWVVVEADSGQKILFIGTNPIIRETVEKIIATPELGFRCGGFIEEAGEADDPIPGCEHRGTLADLRKAVAEVQPDRIVVGMRERRSRLPMQDLLDLRFSGILIQQAGALYEAAFGRVSTRELHPSELIFTAELGPRHSSVALQSLYSFFIGVVLVIVFAPIMAITALLVKLTSPGPVLYGQIRVGKGDRPFRIYKFRSMYVDAEKRTGAVWATKNDARITPLGRWLRTLRLDELPQLFNVLRGEMSIVGPRPERPEFTKVLEQQIPFYRQRHCVKPGVTGWAQINHKYGDTIEDTITKLEYDLYYIKNLSLSLDLYIVFSTIKTVLLGRGAQ